MGRRHGMRSGIALYQPAAIARDTKILSQQSLRCACPQTDHDGGPDHLQFGVEPWTTGFDFRVPRLLMDTTLAALRRFPLEMFHHIGDINFGAIDSDLR